MARLHPARLASIVITLFGAITNLVVTIQVLGAWRSLKWIPESEWDGSGINWRVDGVKIVWGLLSVYFASAATVCAIGFVGIVKSKASAVRFYRDYSIADFSFSTFFAIVATYGAFHTAARTGTCEELSRHPELMRDMLEMGLNLENCERWFERAVFAFVAWIIIITVVRLHFLLAVSKYYSHLMRHGQRASGLLPVYRDSVPHAHTQPRPYRTKSSDSPQRIYLLPRPSSSEMQGDQNNTILVYAPVPLGSLSAEAVQDLRTSATEAWVSPMDPEQPLSRPHRHHRHHSRRSTSGDRTGLIRLPINSDEGLFSQHDNEAALKA